MASRYERFFREADKDGNGYLTFDELIHIIREKGYRGSDDKLRVSIITRHAVRPYRPK